jgi:hypothetical protein
MGVKMSAGDSYNAKVHMRQGGDVLGISTGGSFEADGDLPVTCGTNKTVTISPVMWDDMRVPLSAIRVGAVKVPGFAKLQEASTGSDGVFAFHFDDAAQEQVHFATQLPHAFAEGSTSIEPHVHWCSTGASTGKVTWGLEYSWANVNKPFPFTSTLKVAQAAVGNLTHQIAAFGSIPASTANISSMLLCRLFRCATGSSDTYAADAALLEVDFHFPMNTVGSRQRFLK